MGRDLPHFALDQRLRPAGTRNIQIAQPAMYQRSTRRRPARQIIHFTKENDPPYRAMQPLMPPNDGEVEYFVQ
jgi:hypothetical protein